MSNNTLNTEWGIAKVYNGYYKVYSQYKGKCEYLHRLIYKKHYGEIPEGSIIHHIDGNSLNNNPTNLQCVTLSEHTKIHKTGIKNHNYGKKLSKEHRRKISEAHKGKKFSKESKQKISKAKKGWGNWSAKYTLWDILKVHYNKREFREKNPLRKSFQCKYDGVQLPIGYFNEFVSCEIISDFIQKEAIR